MLKKRIIVCLDIKENRVVKGVNFEQLVELGDPVLLAKNYAEQGADELVFLDITASIENRSTRFQWVRKVAEVLNIPFTVGGGVRNYQDAWQLLLNGADKISINTAAVENPYLIRELSEKIGSQSVVVAIDVKRDDNGQYKVFTHGGKRPTDINLVDWMIKAQELGCGEFLITGIHADGTNNGFDIELYKLACEYSEVPIIASGGAGDKHHFLEVFRNTCVDAALAAGIFHRGELKIKDLKSYLHQNNINVRL